MDRPKSKNIETQTVDASQTFERPDPEPVQLPVTASYPSPTQIDDGADVEPKIEKR